jgi:DNA-binding response OmpR family regulator
MEKSQTLLVVDDDIDFLNGMSVLLLGEGYSVHTAADYEAAWKIIQETKPEVLVLDWNLPGTDGLGLLRQLRATDEHRNRYVIMVSARGSRSDLVQGIHEGADDYLRKPFDNDELVARVEVGFRTRALERELTEQIRKTTVLEMAGTVAHEIGNPLFAAKLLQHRLSQHAEVMENAALSHEVSALGTELQRIESLVRKAQSLSRVVSKPYAGDLRIIDLRGDAPVNGGR